MSVSIPYCSKNIRGQGHLGAIKPKTKGKKRVRRNDLSKRAQVEPQSGKPKKKYAIYIFICISLRKVTVSSLVHIHLVLMTATHFRPCLDSRLKQIASQNRSKRWTIICKWSDRIIRSRNHQRICKGCYGNEVGISYSGRCWCSFPTQKHDQSRRSRNNYTLKLQSTQFILMQLHRHSL